MMRRSDEDGARRSRWCRFLGAILLAAGLSQAEPPKATSQLETNLLVIPQKSAGYDMQLPLAADLRATVGKKDYEVRSVTRAIDSADYRIEIVFDLASTAPENRPCLLLQALEETREYPRGGTVEVLVVSPEWTGAQGDIGEVGDRDYGYFLPGAVSDSACAQPAGRHNWTDQAVLAGDLSTISFRGLAATLARKRGPVLVIWVGQRFGWFHTWNWEVTSTCDENGCSYSYYATPGPDAADPYMPDLTRVGVAVYPIVWLNGRSANSSAAHRSLKYASEIAARLGGRATVCDTAPAAAAREIVDASLRAWIVSVIGPRTKASSKAVLDVQYAPEPALMNVKRRFDRIEDLFPQTPANGGYYEMRTPTVPIFDTEWLIGTAGCDAALGPGSAKWTMTALIPERLGPVQDLPTKVQFFQTQAPPAPGQKAPQRKRQEPGANLTLKTRTDGHAAPIGQDTAWAAPPAGSPGESGLKTRDAPSSAAGPAGYTQLCINLPPVFSGDGYYKVMIVDPKARWSAVGALPLADVVRYQRKHGLTGAH